MHSFSSLTVLLAALFRFPFSLAFHINEWQEGQGRNAVIDLQNTPFAEYWNSLPLLELHQLSSEDNSNYLKVDGNSFKGRMAIYHFLINSIDSSDLWGETSLREYHWLWAYAAQLDWQNRSNRLQSAVDDNDNENSSRDNDIISPESWWGYMNFGFSVAILLGWKETRPDITIQLDSVSLHLVEHDNAMQKCIKGWEDFFRNGYREFVDTLDHAPSKLDARYKLQQHVWEAHTSVFSYCQNEGTVYSNLLDKMHPPERQFGDGWARMVHVLAAACFPTDLVTLKQDGGGFLPLQPLTTEAWENMPTLNYYDACRRRTVAATHDLITMRPWQLQGMAGFWKRVAQNEQISRRLPRTVVDLYHGSLSTKLLQLSKLMKWFFRPHELIAMAAAVFFPFFLKMLR